MAQFLSHIYAKVVPESKEVLKKQTDGACQKDTGDNWKASQGPKLKQFG